LCPAQLTKNARIPELTSLKPETVTRTYVRLSPTATGSFAPNRPAEFTLPFESLFLIILPRYLPDIRRRLMGNIPRADIRVIPAAAAASKFEWA
jgi:hypothetical protein